MLYGTELIIACVFLVPVLILTTTVVSPKLCLQKVVHHTNYGVCPFSSLCSLFNKVKNNKHWVIQVFFYLEHIYLSWYPLTAHTKYSTLSWCQRVHRTWLLWITGVVNLSDESHHVKV